MVSPIRLREMPDLARRVAGLVAATGIPCDTDTGRGLDHGAWVPLMLMYPDAGIPVVQLSIQGHLDPARHLALGDAIAPLRQEGVLVIGSGGAVHPLGDPSVALGKGLPTEAWAIAFNDWLNRVITAGDRAESCPLPRACTIGSPCPAVSRPFHAAARCSWCRRAGSKGNDHPPELVLGQPRDGCVRIPVKAGQAIYSAFRYAPFGTIISKTAPSPGMPVSWMVIPVIARISRARKSPRPVFFPYPFSKIFFFSPGGIPHPLSAKVMTSPSSLSLAPDRDGRHPLPVLHRIIEKVEKDLVDHRVGKDLDCIAGVVQRYLLGPDTADNFVDREPCRCMHPEFLVGLRELDLALDRLDRGQ